MFFPGPILLGAPIYAPGAKERVVELPGRSDVWNDDRGTTPYGKPPIFVQRPLGETPVIQLVKDRKTLSCAVWTQADILLVRNGGAVLVPFEPDPSCPPSKPF